MSAEMWYWRSISSRDWSGELDACGRGIGQHIQESGGRSRLGNLLKVA
jgi:hypothetical protein